jgi:peptidoglycan/LPS O-acetylase OafA/YrhL
MNAAHDDSIRPLTSLRFIAALLVFLSHYGGYPYGRAEQFWQSILIEGHAGVTIFFVLSGFLITLRYLPLITERRFSLYDYFLRRAARILPLYWILLAVSLILSPYTPVKVFAPFPLANVLLVQAYFKQLSTTFIVAAWSLTVEGSFYIVAPVILHFCAAFGRDTRSIFITLVVWVLGLFGIGLVLVWIARTGGLNQPYGFMEDFDFMIHGTLFGRGFNFGVGIFLAWLYLKYRSTLWMRTTAVQTAPMLFILCLLGIGASQIAMNVAGGALSGWPFNYAVAFFAGLMILSLTCPTGYVVRLLSNRLLVYTGRTSYALFLLQTSTLGVSLYLLLPVGIFAMPVLYLLLNVLSAICYEIIEQPCNRLLVRASEHLQLRRA